MAKKNKKPSNVIAQNKKTRHDFFIEDNFEAGLSLLGWEVKSLRAGKVQLNESYVLIKNGELFLFGAHIMPLNSASTHVDTDPLRIRKLLMHKHEISRLIGSVDRQGYTLVVTSLYWSKGKVKASVGLAKGKKQHDKRATEKERDWQRDKARILKAHWLNLIHRFARLRYLSSLSQLIPHARALFSNFIQQGLVQLHILIAGL